MGAKGILARSLVPPTMSFEGPKGRGLLSRILGLGLHKENGHNMEAGITSGCRSRGSISFSIIPIYISVESQFPFHCPCAFPCDSPLLGGGTVKLFGRTKGTLLGTPNREPQEYSRNIMEYKDPGRYIPIIYLLYSWGSRFGVPVESL